MGSISNIKLPSMTALSIVVMVSFAVAQTLIPDPVLTPGEVASTDFDDVCNSTPPSYSKRHRGPNYKAEIIRRYSLESFEGEIDHRVPLALGGADSLKNKWPQLWGGKCGAGAKDRLEVQLWEAVCQERRMPLAEAQAVFMGSYWTKLGGCLIE